jgi:dnd system-associated protein 4
MRELRDEGGFPTYRDILLFCAAVGAYIKRRVPFSATGEPIRYETLTEPNFAATLVNMIAATAAEFTDDPEIMDSTRLAERLRVFEEYVNGGLEYIQEQVNSRHEPANVVIISLVTEALSSNGAPEAASVEELLGGVSW